MKQKAIPPITLTAGQSARLTFNITVPDGTAIPTLIGALTVRNQRVDMTTDGSSALIIPPLPPGVHLAEVRAGGTCILYGHIEVLPSPLSNTTGIQDYTVDIDMTADVLTVNLTLAGGPAGEPGASAYQIWLNDGNSGTETDFLADLVGPAGDPGPQGEPGPQGDPGETGPAPSHEWQGTSLRFANPDGTWGNYVDLQGPQGEAGTGGGGTITIDDTPTKGSDNAVSSGGVYNWLYSYNVALGQGAYPLSSSYDCTVSIGTYANASGFASAAIGADAKSYADNAIAIGVGTVAEAESSCVLGGGGYIADTGVTVINAGGEITDGKSTQLYLIPAGSYMANLYTGGAAGLGFVVLDHLSGSVVARGTIQLAAICTAHAADFSPSYVTSIIEY